jgi:hypothetical protein
MWQGLVLDTKFYSENLKVIDHIEDLGVDVIRILKYILKVHEYGLN